MYCPRCAAPNIEDAKFCRACGTDLELVSLALAGRSVSDLTKEKAKKHKTPKSPVEKRVEGAHDIVQGAILLATSAVVCVGFGLFVNQADWFLIWAIFFGWMACWGVFALAAGIGNILESKIISRENERGIGGLTAHLRPADEPRMVSDMTPRLSVTEHTTEPLGKHRPASKQVN